jgi:hypothetical protein
MNKPGLKDIIDYIKSSGITECESTDCGDCPFNVHSPESKEFIGNPNICVLLNEVAKTTESKETIIEYTDKSLLTHINGEECLLVPVGTDGLIDSHLWRIIGILFEEEYSIVRKGIDEGTFVLGSFAKYDKTYRCENFTLCFIVVKDKSMYNDSGTTNRSDVLENALYNVRKSIHSTKFLIPYDIGCRLDFETVLTIINEQLHGCTVIIDNK